MWIAWCVRSSEKPPPRRIPITVSYCRSIAGPGRGPRLDDVGRPRMAEEHAARAEDGLAQRRLPAAARVDGRDLAHDDLDHAVEQVVLAAHVGVERHRLDAELLAEPAHADRFDPVPIRQLDGSLEHTLSRQRLAPLRVLDLHSQIAP